MRALFLVPARAGSKGVRGKNLRHVGGMSLVARAVHAARRSVRRCRIDDAIVLIDTDADEIAAEARQWGAEAPFLRPVALAKDDTPTIDSTLQALERIERLRGAIDVIVLLQPTSPLRTTEDIQRCWEMFDPTDCPSVVSIAPAPHAVALAVRQLSDGTLGWLAENERRAGRRQDNPANYVLNGAVYVVSVPWLRDHRQFFVSGVTRGVVMAPERSVDVDTPAELLIADALARSPAARIAIDERTIGPGCACFVIAEAGVNHDGDVQLAHRLIDVAADAGADAVKFQTFDPDRTVAPTAPQADYQRTNTGRQESQRDMLRRLVLSRAAHFELKAHAVERGLTFLSTPFDEDSADFLEELSVPAFKIPSGELTNHAFLAHVAAKGKPLVISTGMSTLAEIADALDVVENNGDPPVALLHCVTNYPADPTECNLQAISSMAAAFGRPVGWSDHTLGLTVSCAAVALGACVLEKHFTLDRNLPGPDHRASLEPPELRALVEAIRTIHSSFGDGVKRPTPSERELAKVARRSLHAASDLPAGHAIGIEDLVALRPGEGIPPSRRNELVGRRLRQALLAGQIIRETDFA